MRYEGYYRVGQQNKCYLNNVGLTSGRMSVGSRVTVGGKSAVHRFNVGPASLPYAIE